MTSTDLRPAPSPALSPGQHAVRLTVVAVTGAAGLFAAFWSAFFAVVLVSGCFLSCSEPPPEEVVGGLALGALACGLAAAGPLVGAALYRSRSWLTASWVVAGLAGVAQLVVLSGQ
jgi:hypothetical protein